MADRESSGEVWDLSSGNFIDVYEYEVLRKATNNFHHSQVLGKGGFGVVYRGELEDKGMVAVKVLFPGHPKMHEQFFNEIDILSSLHHQNLIVLHGCSSPGYPQLLLVYELMPNGTVEDHLHGKLASKGALTWDLRIQIAIQTAEALAYLHSRDPPVIHRDVKSSNILLDGNFDAKVADMGLCRIFSLDATHVSTRPQGTPGYLDPEYYLTFKLTDKSDSYSFGVVLLELISGRPAFDKERDMDNAFLTRVAINLIRNNELEKLIDPKLMCHYLDNIDVKRMVFLVAKLACCCLSSEGKKRPSMIEIISALNDITDGKQQAETAIDLYYLLADSPHTSGSTSTSTNSEMRSLSLEPNTLSNAFKNLGEAIHIVYDDAIKDATCTLSPYVVDVQEPIVSNVEEAIDKIESFVEDAKAMIVPHVEDATDTKDTIVSFIQEAKDNMTSLIGDSRNMIESHVETVTTDTKDTILSFAGDAKDTIAPHIEAAKDIIATHVEDVINAKDSVLCFIGDGKDTIAPHVEDIKDTIMSLGLSTFTFASNLF